MKTYLKLSIFLLLIAISLQSYGQSTSRIVSLAPSITKCIYFLEADSKLLGCTSFCGVDVSDKKEIVASAIAVNIEKVLTLKPDLILTTALTKQKTITTLRQFGIKVKVFETPVSFSEICDQFIEIGQLIGKEKMANEIIEREKVKVANLQKQISTQNNHPKVFFQIGTKPLFTVLSNTFMDDFITYIGGTNIAANQTVGTITRENVLLQNPDIIIIASMGVVGKEEKQTWENFSYLNASKNNKIFFVDADLACNPTPITFTKTLEEIVKRVKNN